MPFGRSQDGSGLGLDTLDVRRPGLRSGDMDKCPKATKLGPRPLHSLGRPWEVLLTLECPGPRWATAHGIMRWLRSTKPPLPATAMSPIRVLGHMEHIHALISSRFDPRAINTCHMDWRAHCPTQKGVTDQSNHLTSMQPPSGVHPSRWIIRQWKWTIGRWSRTSANAQVWPPTFT